ncbi:ABC transporter substrate-binding protein [Aestuariivirga sp.]|uniref:ABC transporter substrate-binding protein n=1 Tax=Aestuariivirga sp. TaxID=2650926 RepID=UPI003BA8F061
MTNLPINRRTFVGMSALAAFMPRLAIAKDDNTIVFVADYLVKAAPPPGSYDIQIEPLYGNAEFLMRPTWEGPKPWLAEKVEEVEPTRWRITLKPGLTFQNGNPLNAEVLKACLEYYKTSKENQGDAGCTLIGSPKAFEVKSERELDLVLEKPYPMVPFGCAHYAYIIFDAPTVAAAKGDYASLVNKGILTGPFAWSSIEAGKITYKANESYWGGKPKLTGVEIRQVPDEQAGLQAIAAGEADVLAYPALALALAAKGMSNVHYKVTDGVGFVGLLPNNNKAPFDDVRVRKSVSLAIDNDALAAGVGMGLGTTMKGWFPSDHGLALDFIVYDPAKAVALLDEAGWATGADGLRSKDGKPLEARFYCYTAIGEGIATASADMLKKAGFAATVRRFEHYSEIPPVHEKDGGIYTVYTESIGLNANPLGTLYSVFGTSYGGRTYADIRDVLMPVLSSSDPVAIRDAMMKALRLNAEQYYWLPTIDDKSRFILSDRFQGMPLNPFYILIDANTAPAG